MMVAAAQEPVRRNTFQTEQRRIQMNRIKHEQLNDCCMSFMIVILWLLYGMGDVPECSIAPLRMWVNVEFYYYLFNMVFTWSYYSYVKRHNRENHRFLVLNCFLNVAHTGWLIYGNVIYWKYNAACNQEFQDQHSYNGQNLQWIMLIMIVLGYIPMIKCCSISTLILCFGPTIYRQMRRARQPDAAWVPTQTDLLKNMLKGKFKPEEHPEGTECIICMVEYTPEDEVVSLPCDGRHFFHSECITNWLKSNNSCPLCKKPITKEDLEKQKKELKRNRQPQGSSVALEQAEEPLRVNA